MSEQSIEVPYGQDTEQSDPAQEEMSVIKTWKPQFVGDTTPLQPGIVSVEQIPEND